MPKKKQKKQSIDLESLRTKLKLKSIQEKLKFDTRFPHAKVIGAGVLAGALLLSPSAVKNLPSPYPKETISIAKSTPQDILVSDLKSILPAKIRTLTEDQEKKLSGIFKSILGISAVGTLEGEHLNTTYGLIGAEQHLRRYPGDTLDQQGNFGSYDEGMAPGLGAWGYFASSKDKMTPDLVEKEKWYVVVQTLYLPDWNKRLAYLRDWYKYRKVLVVNTENGSAVVGDIADSGPAAWTGKVFGGSPEVMEALGGVKYKVGPVVLFFLDDPQNKIPLGPVAYNAITANLANANVQLK
jgi:hypothetical protein